MAEAMTTYGTILKSSLEGTNFEFISRAKHQLKSGLDTRRPWKQMFQIHSINFPSGFNDAIGRIETNVGYFRMNYVIIVLLFIFLSLLWHPISLIVFVALMAVWLFLYFLRDEPLVIFHCSIDERVVLIILSVVTVVLLLLTSATVNIAVSVLVGLVVVAIHAALRKTDDLFLDEEAAEIGGLLTSSP